ncbi:tetratricopeptide repeat protein [Carboxylicivirga caseinilyticus]|uniref:type IX secretion system periplasmic lipoprotein PorW/SprE n=1 Tax=Carboxylicivirga caseinilyticus TaxID=3417572 RepID=UPI003D3495CD|nr:tetratricopeptide repeat protein [Marinilabiliaceae bacterium A049]
MIYRRTGFVLIVILVLVGCSTKKNTWLSRNYHNLTAYYNVYFNGKEALNAGVKSIRDGYNNDYNRILPMYESSDKSAIGVATSNMERAIEKGGKLIKKHSITAKPKKKSGSKSTRSAEFYSQKEYNEWVDDAYLLIGKAQFYKHDFLPAIRTFQYVIREYNNKPAQYEGLIWLARAYTEYQDYIGALSALESYDLGGNAPIDLYGEYMAAYANLLLKQGKYPEAIPYLKNNIANNVDRKQRLRFTYILGQLYLETNQKKEAVEAFTYVSKNSPDYEMTFNAKVIKASVLYNDADIATVKKELTKLRKDKKNKEYLDRIYWAFGQVSEQENDLDEALAYYIKSINSSIDNNDQKAQSYIDAAEIYYNRFDYPDAYYYYDSALMVINEEVESYDELVERHAGLSGLVENILIVENEDSLQRLADMSEPVLLAYLDDIIDKKKKEEEERLERERQEKEDSEDPFFLQNNQSTVNSNQSGGKWYFYNQVSKASGKTEFQKRWGKRKLEDNWRRSDKSKNMDEDLMPEDPFDAPDNPLADALGKKADEAAEEDSPSTPSSGNIPTRQQLLADIPLTPEARAVSDDKIETSLMEMGLLFMDRLENYPKSIESLEDLLKRYPEGRMRDQALVALYNAYRLNRDETGMASTRRRLETEFPDSRFVTYLNDPDFFSKLDKIQKEQDLAYEKTYEDFLFGRFIDVIGKSSEVIESKNDNPLLPKYYLLRALSQGKLGNTGFFRSDLDSLIIKAPGTEESALAEQLIKHLEEGKTPVQGTLFSATPQGSRTSSDINNLSDEGGTSANQLQFVYTENEPYELVVMKIEPANVNRAIYNVADYNFSRYLLHDFEIKEQTLINGDKAIIVSGFKNKGEAMDYFYSLRERPEFFKFDFFKDNIAVISQSNANKFYLSGLIKEYMEFFNTYYLTMVTKKELDKVRKEEPEIDESASKQEEEKVEELIETTAEQAKETTEVEENKAGDKVEEAANVTTSPVADSTKTEEVKQPEKPKRRSIYSYAPDTTHNIIVIIEKTRLDYNRLKTIYANFARNKFGTRIKVDLIDLGSNYRALNIAGFNNADEAKAFIGEINSNDFLTRDIIRKEHFIWSISPANLEILLKRPTLRSYEMFYKDYY